MFNLWPSEEHFQEVDPLNLSDKELVDRIRSNEQEAYYMLFNRHWEPMYAFAQSLIKDSETAKDILQDVWLSLWARREAIYNENIKAYLMQAVKFRVYKELRDGRLLAEHESYLTTLSNDPLSDDILQHKELELNIENWIEKLPPKRKEVFKLSRYEELTNKEIAEKLGISQRTVETHISHALKFLREKLGPFSFVLLFLK